MLRNGYVVTMDANAPLASALATRGERLIAVLTLLGGRAVYPAGVDVASEALSDYHSTERKSSRHRQNVTN